MPFEAWCFPGFGATAKKGLAAESADTEADGFLNLSDSALGTDCNAVTLLTAETTTVLGSTWSTTDITDTPIGATATPRTRIAKVPLTGVGARFLRLKVTKP